MFTVCPKCTLTLAVTAGDLRLGQGYVRCGRCSNVFNALLRLTEALGDADAAAAAPPQADPASTAQIRQALSSAALSASSRPAVMPKPPPAASPAPTGAIGPSAPPAAIAPMTAAAGTLAARLDPPPAPAAGASPEAEAKGAQREADSDAIGQFEQVLHTLGISLLEEEPIPVNEQQVPPSRPPAAAAALSRPHAARPVEAMDELDALTRRLAAATGEATDTDTDTAAHSDVIEFELLDTAAGDEDRDGVPDSHEDVTDSVMDLDIPELRPAARRWPWVLGCLVLAPLLVLQALNHWKLTLAASSTWGKPISRVYALLGIPLQPHWNLGAYDVHQQGAEADSGSSQVIHVRLSLANRATYPQPTPLLRLTLLDRYGKRIAQRDLTPADYWPKGHAPQRFLASDERIDSEVAVRDPSAASASFELDVCLRGAAGTVRCAGDSTPLASAAIP